MWQKKKYLYLTSFQRDKIVKCKNENFRSLGETTEAANILCTGKNFLKKTKGVNYEGKDCQILIH